MNLSAKERIGQRAAALVEDGDIIVLDTGTTTLHIARNIRDRQNVTVVTNDYQIARELEASPSIQTILLGGIVQEGIPLRGGDQRTFHSRHAKRR